MPRKGMDSAAYSALAAALREAAESTVPPLPVAPLQGETDELRGPIRRLQRILDAGFPADLRALSPVFHTARQGLGGILAHVHHLALNGVMSGEESTSARRAGAETVRLLSSSVTSHYSGIIDDNDVVSLSAACFLLECCLHLGWSPNACEGFAKRAAHVYFARMKRMLHAASPAVVTTVAAYVQTLRPLAQVTEGIREQPLEAEKGGLTRSFSWNIGQSTANYRLFSENTPRVRFLLPLGSDTVPHPFRKASREPELGMKLYTNRGELIPRSCGGYEEIRRRRTWGMQASFACATEEDYQAEWKVVIQVFEATLYRIDAIQCRPGNALRITDAELRLENEIPLTKTDSPGKYIGKTGHENYVLELVRNPLGLALTNQPPGEITVLKGGSRDLSRAISVAAWTRGRYVTGINRTNLLGLID